MDASCTSLEELVFASSGLPGGLREYLHFLREYRSATDPAPMHMPNLQSLMLRIWSSLNLGSSAWPVLDDAKEILDVASTSSLAVLNVVFSPNVLCLLPERANNPSLRLFEQSIAQITTGQTNVSFSTEHERKNREICWATPFLTQAFPVLNGQGRLKVSSQ